MGIALSVLLVFIDWLATQIDDLNALRDWWEAKLEIDGLLLTGGLDRPEGNSP